MAHIYGYDNESKLALRALKDGKLKTRVFKNEEYPPFSSDCPELSSDYVSLPKNILPKKLLNDRFQDLWFSRSREKPKWAIGKPDLGQNPFLFVLSTLWLREHNRVCDVLSSEHRDWTDEQLYETAKLIVTGTLQFASVISALTLVFAR